MDPPLPAMAHLFSMATGAAATGIAALAGPLAAQVAHVPSGGAAAELTASIAPIALASELERHPSARGGGAGRFASADLAGPEAHDVADVSRLAKAVKIGEALARRDAARRSATADGASDVAVGDDGTFVRPADGVLTSMAGPRWGTTHYGLDIANDVGTPIFAVTDGVVEESGPASGFGLWVRVRHPGGWTSVYGHIDRSLVQKGQRVRAGERIALMGNRGQSTGPHLHVEIWDADDAKVDPRGWLAARGIGIA